MNISEILNVNFPEKIEQNIRGNFVFVGSRSILQNLPPETDYDYMGEATEENQKKLSDIGFYPKIISIEYMDIATHSVWTNPFVNIQVVLKHPNHYKNCIKMWDIFKHNPNLFKDYFWKSNPDNIIDRNKVRNRIDQFLTFIGLTND